MASFLRFKASLPSGIYGDFTIADYVEKPKRDFIPPCASTLS